MRPMSKAPKDGMVIRLHMPDGHSFLARPVDGLIDCDGNDAWSWGSLIEGTEPADWTDGVMWTVNEDGKPSTRPVGWSPVEHDPPRTGIEKRRL